MWTGPAPCAPRDLTRALYDPRALLPTRLSLYLSSTKSALASRVGVHQLAGSIHPVCSPAVPRAHAGGCPRAAFATLVGLMSHAVGRELEMRSNRPTYGAAWASTDERVFPISRSRTRSRVRRANTQNLYNCKTRTFTRANVQYSTCIAINEWALSGAGVTSGPVWTGGRRAHSSDHSHGTSTAGWTARVARAIMERLATRPVTGARSAACVSCQWWGRSQPQRKPPRRLP